MRLAFFVAAGPQCPRYSARNSAAETAGRAPDSDIPAGFAAHAVHVLGGGHACLRRLEGFGVMILVAVRAEACLLELDQLGDDLGAGEGRARLRGEGDGRRGDEGGQQEVGDRVLHDPDS